jgi:hypothetical protein
VTKVLVYIMSIKSIQWFEFSHSKRSEEVKVDEVGNPVPFIEEKIERCSLPMGLASEGDETALYHHQHPLLTDLLSSNTKKTRQEHNLEAPQSDRATKAAAHHEPGREPGLPAMPMRNVTDKLYAFDPSGLSSG